MKTATKVTIGTSGWQYKDWNGLFYPIDVKGKNQLAYFAGAFDSVEINSTFYHMPRSSSVENWAMNVPDTFQFVIKMNRFFTHTKRLVPDEQFAQHLEEFLRSLLPLGNKLAAILVQLPPSMKADNSRLHNLAQLVSRNERSIGTTFPLALEFRHSSWFDEETFEVMRRLNIANVINDSPNRWPSSKEITANFAYIRFHGNRELYRSSYSDQELSDWAHFIHGLPDACERALCYFNNDYEGVAIRNAQTLKRLTS